MAEPTWDYAAKPKGLASTKTLSYNTNTPYSVYNKANQENIFGTPFNIDNAAQDSASIASYDAGIVTPHTNLYDNMGGSQNYNPKPPSETGWFGRDGYLAGGAAIAQGIGGLANAYTGYKNYQLAQDQFESEKAYAGANLYNQGTLINNQIKNAAEVGQSLAGDTMTADQRAAGLAGLASKYVKTAV